MLTKDVVCEMQVEAGSNLITYAGSSYSFCSKQCQERFLANPHLYVGTPGQKAPKQEGRSVIKQRRLHLAQPLSLSQAKTLSGGLQSMMGIQSVSAEGESVTITYDLLQVTEKQIENNLAEIGVQLGEGLGERLRRSFVQFEEECEVGNLQVHEDDIGPLYEAFRRDER